MDNPFAETADDAMHRRRVMTILGAVRRHNDTITDQQTEGNK